MKNIMKPREMALFAGVCRTGSVTQAATEVGLSQPAASNMLKDLEARIGTTLFSRQSRRLVLTATGRSLLPDVTHALAALDAVDKRVQSMGRGTGQPLTIGTVSAAGASVIPSAVRALQLQEPARTVIVKVGTAAEVIEMAIQQRIELGVVLGSGAHEHVGFQKIADLGLVCVVRPDHRWANRSSIGVGELAAHPYIAHSRHLPVGAATALALEAEGVAWQPSIEIVQFSAACGLTDAGCGPCILESLTGSYARKLGLVPVPIETKETLTLNVVWPLSRGLSPASRIVMDNIGETLAA